ncbi:MAG: sigma-70 family RNA polymerase sigma factor [Planctomycetes bacterium]|nr:sigma-70 family RNA polymerase sigma factor [Planctomycetota bacterium]
MRQRGAIPAGEGWGLLRLLTTVCVAKARRVTCIIHRVEEVERLAKAKAGDRAAFESLVLPHREGIRRFVELMIGGEAEDVAQEAIARAFDHLSEFDGRSKLSTWIYGIALNIARNLLRARARHAGAASPSVLNAQPAPRGRRQGVLSSILRHEMADRMQDAIARLPDDLREAFVLRYVEGMEYEEMSRIAGVAPGTLRVRSHRARNLLKEELGPVVDTMWNK